MTPGAAAAFFETFLNSYSRYWLTAPSDGLGRITVIDLQSELLESMRTAVGLIRQAGEDASALFAPFDRGRRQAVARVCLRARSYFLSRAVVGRQDSAELARRAYERAVAAARREPSAACWSRLLSAAGDLKSAMEIDGGPPEGIARRERCEALAGKRSRRPAALVRLTRPRGEEGSMAAIGGPAGSWGPNGAGGHPTGPDEECRRASYLREQARLLRAESRALRTDVKQLQEFTRELVSQALSLVATIGPVVEP